MDKKSTEIARKEVRQTLGAGSTNQPQNLLQGREWRQLVVTQPMAGRWPTASLGHDNRLWCPCSPFRQPDFLFKHCFRRVFMGEARMFLGEFSLGLTNKNPNRENQARELRIHVGEFGFKLCGFDFHSIRPKFSLLFLSLFLYLFHILFLFLSFEHVSLDYIQFKCLVFIVILCSVIDLIQLRIGLFLYFMFDQPSWQLCLLWIV